MHLGGLANLILPILQRTAAAPTFQDPLALEDGLAGADSLPEPSGLSPQSDPELEREGAACSSLIG